MKTPIFPVPSLLRAAVPHISELRAHANQGQVSLHETSWCSWSRSTGPFLGVRLALASGA